MGGKSYFCDYCGCYMKNDVNVRKTHNEGMLHRMNKIRYMKKFEDPRKVYEEEIAKEPCSHFLKGRCRYDLMCQSSHFSPKQLKELKQIVDKINQKKEQHKLKAQTISIIHLLPWNQGEVVVPSHRKHNMDKNLPPSLRPLNLKKYVKLMNSTNTWGGD